jgi:hypothetical protein
MNIVQRNFYRLIRNGIFGHQELIEPMSVFKWSKLFQLAIMHEVVQQVWEGLQHSKNQFMLHLTPQQWELWEKTVKEYAEKAETEEDVFLRADHLTNPVLNHQLQTILDDEHSDVSTRQLLLTIIHVARHILNEGVPVRQLVELGTCLYQQHEHIDFEMLQRWMKRLRFEQMAQLEGAMLVQMFGFDATDIPFLQGKVKKDAAAVALELTEFTNTRSRDFYFSQDSGDIFVHTSNGSAMLGHLRRSARYFRYIPSEIVTNFFRSFAHSLSHIEE